MRKNALIAILVLASIFISSPSSMAEETNVNIQIGKNWITIDELKSKANAYLDSKGVARLKDASVSFWISPDKRTDFVKITFSLGIGREFVQVCFNKDGMPVSHRSGILGDRVGSSKK